MYTQLRPGMDDFSDRGGESVNVFGRLKPGISPAQAQADLSFVARRLVETYPAADPDKNRTLEGTRLYPIDRAPEVEDRAVTFDAVPILRPSELLDMKERQHEHRPR